MLYEAIPKFDRGDIEEVLSRGDLRELRLVALSVALHSEDASLAESVCMQLAGHEDRIVRGNSILGFGHIARIHRKLTHDALPLVEAALADPDETVRGRATSAADDIEQFLGRSLSRP
jgi:hypothetical protein